MYYKVLIVEDDPMVSMINEQYVNRKKPFVLWEHVRTEKVLLHIWKITT